MSNQKRVNQCVTAVFECTSWDETLNATRLPPMSLHVKRALTARGCYDGGERLILNRDGPNVLLPNSNVAARSDILLSFVFFCHNTSTGWLSLGHFAVGARSVGLCHLQCCSQFHLWAGAHDIDGFIWNYTTTGITNRILSTENSR